MKHESLNRRDFNELTMAAFGGIVAGTIAGCGGGETDTAGGKNGSGGNGESETSTPEAGGNGEDDSDATQVATNDWTGETHVCRGLNACQNQGASGDNACAGQGTCATATTHSCHEMNDCKFQGGCGESVGTNACKGQGECSVPLSDGAWTKAREKFEAAMEAAGKTVGEAPQAP